MLAVSAAYTGGVACHLHNSELSRDWGLGVVPAKARVIAEMTSQHHETQMTIEKDQKQSFFTSAFHGWFQFQKNILSKEVSYR